MPFKKNNPGCDCCGSCTIDPGWECDVKNGIASSDLTGWSVDSGTWDATQDWESGTTADTLTTSSSNARISCDTAESSPLDDRITVWHFITVTDDADEAIVWLAGHKVVLKVGETKIYDPSSNLLTSASFGLTRDTQIGIEVCTYYDAGTGKEYIAVRNGGSGVSGSHELLAETTLGTDGTTAFGTGSVTGSVAFTHFSSTLRDGEFLYNTTKADGTDCLSCRAQECDACPGGDMPRYLTTAVSGLSSPGSGGSCTHCENLNASYINDMTDATGTWCEQESADVLLCENIYDPLTTLYIDYYVSVTTRIVSYGSGWKAQVEFSNGVLYEKAFTSSDLCTDLDDDLSYVSGSGEHDCVGWDSLTVHVTASES